MIFARMIYEANELDLTGIRSCYVFSVYNRMHMQVTTSAPMNAKHAGSGSGLLVSLIFVLITFFFPQITMAQQSGFSEEELARLKSGEILIQTIHADKPGAAARVTALMHTSANEVWSILGYCKYELIYVRGLKLCEILNGDQFQMTVHHRVRSSWYTPTLDFVFAASRDSTGNGKAKLISGDLKVLDAQWKLDQSKSGSSVIVVHEIRIQSKLPAPKWLIRRTFHNDLPNMMACIRGLADASGTDRHIQRDLKRCPGDVAQLDK